METGNSVLGPLIRKLRERLPHYAKASKFASAVGCTREHYRRIEAGTGFPSRNLMQKIIRALEVDQEQSGGLWVAWGMSNIPSDVRSGLMVVRRDHVGRSTSLAVLTELSLMYDVGVEDGEDLTEIIETSIASEEIPWRV
tara:strand:+ start:1428 stop:1847 length:420 start_codon:yes stop_codon:yes gene_type:complete